MASPSSVLLGRNSAVSGLGFGTGYLRTWSITASAETLDVSGVGDTNTLFGLPVRYRAVVFSDFTGSATGMTAGGGGGAPNIGDTITVTSDTGISGAAVVTEVTEDGSYDGLVELSISFESTGS